MPRYESSSSAVRLITDAAAPELDWELLYDVHAARLRRVIQRKVAPGLVEDVLQETFLRAFQSRKSIDHSRPIAPWLITIAIRTAADAHRSQLRSLESVAIDNDESPELALDALEEELLNRARRIGIKHAFASLNTRQRRLLELVAVDGMTYESAAASEAMTTDAVKSVVARARTNFRTSFKAATGEPGVFGVAGVGGWLLKRFRVRTPRSALFIGQHAAGFGAATLSVAIVAVAAVPAVRPLQGHARERQQATVAAAIAGATTFAVPSPPSPPKGAEAHPKPAVAKPSTETPSAAAAVRTNANVSYDAERITAKISGDASASDNHTWTSTFLNVDCTANPTSATQCGILQQLPVRPPL